MKLIKLFLTITAIILSTTTNAAPADDLSTQLNAIHTMRANFTQTIYDNKGRAGQQSRGKMSLERPGKFRWEVIAPIPQTIIANGAKLWVYDPDLEQVTIRSLKQSAGDTPALLLSNVDNTLMQAYNIKPAEQKSDSRFFTLIPKSADSVFASIKLVFLKNQMQEMRLEDHLGHITSIKFQQIETNINLPASLFVFKRTAKVDVIDDTNH